MKHKQQHIKIKREGKILKKKFYLTLDTETATLPWANEICKDEKAKQRVAIARPLVYDIGWVISDRLGNIVKKVNYLVQETFFVPNIFNTAYYCNKRPIYMELLAKQEIIPKCWDEIILELINDIKKVNAVTAYNATFDFKKAIPFTEEYIKKLYSPDYNNWEKKQKAITKRIAENKIKRDEGNPEFLNPVFKLRNISVPIIDLWSIACNRLINIDKYRKYCLDNEYWTASIQFFKTSAETSFQYLEKQYDFVESHTALSDAIIETVILTKALKRGKVEPQIDSFPFRQLGTTFDFVSTKSPKHKNKLINALFNYISENDGWDKKGSYWGKMRNAYNALIGGTNEN